MNKQTQRKEKNTSVKLFTKQKCAMYTDVEVQLFLTSKSQISLEKNIQIFTFDLLQNKTTTFYLLDANTFSYECSQVE
jgi:hypothetical protein